MKKIRFRNFIPAALVGLIAMGTASAQFQASAPVQPASEPTREAVKADLRAWNAAGLGDAWRTESTPIIESPEYRAMYQHYIELSAKQIGGTAQQQPSRQPR